MDLLQQKRKSCKGLLQTSSCILKVMIVEDTLTDWEGAQSVGAEFMGMQLGKSLKIFTPIKILLNNFTELEKCVCQN